MNPIDPKLMAKAARALTAAINARYGIDTDAMLLRLGKWAVRAAPNMDAAFAAVQLLRDLDTIDRAEAAYLLSTLYDDYRQAEDDERYGAAGQAVFDGVELELIRAADRSQKRTRADDFFRERGEDELADLARRKRVFEALCEDGQRSLFAGKPDPEAEMPPDLPAPPRDLAERIVALAATESVAERLPLRQAVYDVLGKADPSATVAAIQSVRAINGITFDESVRLLEMAIEPLVDYELECDREYHRLQRAIAAFNREHGIDEGDGAANESRPLGWQMLEQRRWRRIEGITAGVLRRFGEHRLANLVSAKPEEYYRILDETQIGAKKVVG